MYLVLFFIIKINDKKENIINIKFKTPVDKNEIGNRHNKIKEILFKGSFL